MANRRLSKRTVISARVMLAVTGCVAVIGELLMFANVESVMVTGSALFLFALLLLMLAVARRLKRVGVIGVAHCAICVLFVTLVNTLHWSPGEADLPFKIMGGVYCAIILPFTLRVMRSVREKWPEVQCVTCGYLLYGLTTARCPECGTEFDPAKLPGLSPVEASAKMDPS